MDVTDVKALIFDVFGTVVDWRGSIIEQGKQFGRLYGVAADWDGICRRLARQMPSLYG